MMVGILSSAEGPVRIAGRWPDAGADLVLSPPAPAAEAAAAGLVVLDLPDSELPVAFAAVRAAGGTAAVLSLSPSVTLTELRGLAGPGPALLRAIVPAGSNPGEGMAVLAAEPGTADEALESAKTALEWVGVVEVMSEDVLDEVAALALGGAAFISEALRGMEEGAVRGGLSREMAQAFANQTALATAVLLQQAGSPADLKDLVASPGGTTIAALASLEDAGVRGAYLRAVQRTAVELRTAGRSQRENG